MDASERQALTGFTDHTDTAYGYADVNLEKFPYEQLAAMNQVLLALLHAQAFPQLLERTHAIVSAVAEVHACGYYVLTAEGHLHLRHVVGDPRGCLPTMIPHSSELLLSIQSSTDRGMAPTDPLQPSLFGDGPVCSFSAMRVAGEFAGAIASVHAAESEGFVRLICSQLASSVDFLRIPSYELQGGATQAAMSEVVSEATGTDDSPVERLTAREQEVLGLLCQGLGNKEIAERLYISVATCKHHVESIMAKLGVHTRAAAVAVGLGRLSAHPDEETRP